MSKRDRNYPFLPRPKAFPLDPSDPPAEGWWRDPFEHNMVGQRYHDGTRRTQYVALRSARPWSAILEVPPERSHELSLREKGEESAGQAD